MEHDILGQDISSLSARNLDQTLHHIIGAWNDADPFLAAPRLQDNYRVDLLIAQEREGLPLAHDGRGTERHDLMVKILLQKFLLLRLRRLKINQRDAVLCDLLHQVRIGRVLSLIQTLHFFQDRFDLLL